MYAKNVTLNVQLAVSTEKKQKGLMFVRKLQANSGMLFVYDSPRIVSFWMKNTYVSLDILFLNENFVIQHIEPNTLPMSLKPLSSIYPVQYVLEVSSGFVDKYKIALGDKFYTDLDG